MVICVNDFTIARRSNGVVECHILLDGYLNLLLKPEFCGLNEYHVSSLNGIKERLIVQIGTGVTRDITRVIVSLRLLTQYLNTWLSFLLFHILSETKKNMIKIDQLNVLNL